MTGFRWSECLSAAAEHPNYQLIIVDAEQSGRRLDKYLRSRFKQVPAGALFKLMRQGRLRVNGRKVQENYRLVLGDEIRMPLIDQAHPVQEAAPVPRSLLKLLHNRVIHEDEDLLVIDKPAGIAVHQGTDVSAGVIEAFRQLRPDVPHLELSHRLDRDTSGALVLAKTPSMLRFLHDLLRDREDEIERHYLALVAGYWPETKQEIHAPLRRMEHAVVVDPQGQRAETRIAVKQRVADRASLLDVQLLTGRKHQIRVHLQHEGHPIAGDDRYGRKDFNQRVAGLGSNGLYLHATKILIPKPNGRAVLVESPMPPRWSQLINAGL